MAVLPAALSRRALDMFPLAPAVSRAAKPPGISITKRMVMNGLTRPYLFPGVFSSTAQLLSIQAWTAKPKTGSRTGEVIQDTQSLNYTFAMRAWQAEFDKLGVCGTGDISTGGARTLSIRRAPMQ